MKPSARASPFIVGSRTARAGFSAFCMLNFRSSVQFSI